MRLTCGVLAFIPACNQWLTTPAIDGHLEAGCLTNVLIDARVDRPRRSVTRALSATSPNRQWVTAGLKGSMGGVSRLQAEVSLEFRWQWRLTHPHRGELKTVESAGHKTTVGVSVLARH